MATETYLWTCPECGRSKKRPRGENPSACRRCRGERHAKKHHAPEPAAVLEEVSIGSQLAQLIATLLFLAVGAGMVKAFI